MTIVSANANRPVCSRRHRRLRPLLPVALPLMLAIASCAPYFEEIGEGYSSSGAEWILTSGFDNVAAVHIDEVELSAVALDALRGLVALEPGLEIDRAGDRVMLRLDGGELGGVGLPSSQVPAEWARATVAALELVRKSSSRLRQASVGRILEVMLDSALAGLDRYSRYASPEEARENRAIREGFGGIGVTLERFDDRVLIVSVIADAPAARAGIKANDRLLKVDETAVDDLDVAGIVRLVRGPIDSTARLELIGAGETDPRTVSVRRALILLPTVRYVVESGTAVIRVSGFNQDTAPSLGTTLKDVARAAGRGAIKGVVLDLRANPGGLLDQAVAVADLFLKDGRIVSTRGRHPDSMQLFEAGGRDLVEGLPVVVLINGSSASATEIVAAALQDRGRAVVIGTSSYGKGTVQTVMRLPNDGELTLTWARFHAPSGYAIDRLGVLPTICTSRAAGDPALLVASFKGGRLGGLTDLARRRAADDPAMRRQDSPAAACPWRPGEDKGDFALAAAKHLVADPSLYAGALAAQAPPSKTDRPQAAARPPP
jgi:carboxyl-terminal processing protease